MDSAANQEQARRWNGDGGRRWIAERRRHAGLRQRLTPHLLRAASIAPGERILDVGCGCGEMTLDAARLAQPGGTVLGLDLSAPILAVARESAAEAGVPGVRFVEGDAQVHPLPEGGFDAVLSSFGVMFFDDPGAAFGNLRAALRPGGRLAFLCWQHERHNEFFGIPLRVIAAYAPAPAATCPPPDDLFSDADRISALLAGAGFVDVRVRPVVEPARIGSDVADVLGYVQGSSRVRALIAELDDESLPARVLAAMADEYAARARPDGVWVQAAAWLVTASVPDRA